MTFERAKGSGTSFAPRERLKSTHINTIDENQSKAIDGDAGGEYEPSSPIVVTGSGLDGYFSNMKIQDDEWTYIDSSGDAEQKERSTVLSPLLLKGNTATSTNYLFRADLTTNDGNYYISLPRFPVGSVITDIKMVVTPGAARALSADRVRLAVYRLNGLNFDTVASGSSQQINTTAYDDGTTALQVVSTSINSQYQVQAGAPLSLTVIAGDDAGTYTDYIYGFRITWTDPGPRNY